MDFDPVAPDYAPTRRALHRVATHVLARARQASNGRFGLRVLPGGFGTPMFAEDERVLRVSGGWLLDERRADGRARTAAIALDGASMLGLAAFAGADLEAAFSAGHDTPPLGDLEEPLAIDAGAVATLAHWLAFGVAAIDEAVASLGPAADAGVLQMWPEHFDAGLDVATPAGRLNLGMSPGDSFSEEPYAYVGPWDAARPGRPEYWNASFGAVARASYLAASPDAAVALRDFLHEGLRAMGVPA